MVRRRLAGIFWSFIKVGNDSAREAFGYYSRSDKDERRRIDSSLFMDAVATAYHYIICASVLLGIAPVIPTAFTKDERDEGSDATPFRGIGHLFDSWVKKTFVKYSIQ